MKWWKSKFKRLNHNKQQGEDLKSPQSTSEQFTEDFTIDLERLKKEIGHNWDVRFREFQLGETGIQAAIVYIEGLSDKDRIDKHILSSLMTGISEIKVPLSKEFIINHILTISDVTEENDVTGVVSKVLTGSTALIVEGIPNMLVLGTTKEKSRNIEEPVSEAVVRGPRVGFTETLSDNTALLRQQGANRNLSFLHFQVGQRAKKNLVVAYVHEVANPELVEEVIKRVKQINIDIVSESGYVEQLIEDNYLSPFPQLQNTERPDRVLGALMEGRVAILLDGTPFVLLAPVTFSMLLQSPEDYYERWLPSSLIRLLRFVAAFISLFGPAIYISFTSFHQGLIPTKLALSMMGSREGVPFPAIIEALIMEVAIEILREAGLRLPKPIGQAMGIVGGLVIGEAAVRAGIVSPIMVIVVAITAISSFAIPQYSAGISLRLLRYGAMFFAAVFGLYGVVLFFLFLCSHVVKLKSFGVPYTSPTVPYRASDWKDFFVRMPLMMMKRRPNLLRPKDPIRKD
ncbi:spore germination protein [Sporosarcina sp. Te-1]|uniref:spore germination protein n=1 Tax=Sporosarcina sp. Te-1 TaxID=2818390 RepID=UPI001A9DD89A|nr:spore germination protein [Sporosarcina sp. Te-1]QTD39801.1 spore germination protein [Sporosarcina sp. Te-1]